jgi:hypothetical protein
MSLFSRQPLRRHFRLDGSTTKLAVTSKTSCTFLERLPGEIRNLIFELCILRALVSPKTPASQPKPGENGFSMTVCPRWHGPVSIRMKGIGSIPLLFVCKQIYEELSGLIYSAVDKICIGGYILQHRAEDPSLRWKYAYSLLKKLPNLQNFTRDVKVRLPCMRDDLLRGHWTALGLKYPETSRIHSGKYDPWVVLPDLEAFLSTFTSLSILEIVVTVDKGEPPDFQRLLPLYDLCGKGTSIEFSEPQMPSRFVDRSTWTSCWTIAWNECLLTNGRI